MSKTRNWLDNKNKWEVTVIIKCGGIQEAILNAYGNRIFAPFATDILRELESSSMFWDERTRGFSISTASNINLIGWTTINHANPAEAAAHAYLSLKK